MTAAETKSKSKSEATEVKSNEDRYIVPGLVRGLQALLNFDKNHPEQTLAEIATRLEVNRSTAFRLVYTLEALGFLQKDANGKKYRLAGKVMDLGFSYIAGQDLVETAAPFLQNLRDETETSTHLVVREGREIVYIARYPGKTSLISQVSVGKRLPAHATAPGRILLSRLSMSEVAALYESAKLTKYSDETPLNLSDLIKQTEKDYNEPSIISYGFYEPSIASIAAPIYDMYHNTIAAISVSCPLGTYTQSEFEGRIKKRVEVTALDISHALGYREEFPNN